MKTIRFKFLMPVLAFMLAIVAAFATQKDGQEDFAAKKGYINNNGICEEHGSCTSSSTLLCTDTSNRPVFDKVGATSCGDRLLMNWQP